MIGWMGILKFAYRGDSKYDKLTALSLLSKGDCQKVAAKKYQVPTHLMIVSVN